MPNALRSVNADIPVQLTGARAVRMFRRVSSGCVPLTLALLVMALTTSGARAQDADFTGDWQTYRRTGSAAPTLVQDGDMVSATYAPDDGRVERTVEGCLLSGTWEQPGASRQFLFALTEELGVPFAVPTRTLYLADTAQTTSELLSNQSERVNPGSDLRSSTAQT